MYVCKVSNKVSNLLCNTDLLLAASKDIQTVKILLRQNSPVFNLGY